MRIGEIAKLTGVSVRAIRHYDVCGLLEPTRDQNRYRSFTQADAERVRLIQTFLSVGFRLEEIREHAPCWQSGSTGVLPPVEAHAARDFLRAKLAEIDDRINTLNRLRARLQERLDRVLS